MNRFQGDNRISQEVSASALPIHHLALAHEHSSTVIKPITIPFAQGVGISF